MILIPILDTKEHKIIISNPNPDDIVCDVFLFNSKKTINYFNIWVWIPSNGYIDIPVDQSLITSPDQMLIQISKEGVIVLEDFLYCEDQKNKTNFVLDGHELTLYTNDIISAYIRSHNHFWELDVFEKFYPYLNNIVNIIDCGANIGNHSLMFNKYFPESQIYSFEPSSPNFELLLLNTKKINNIHSFKTALSSKRGTLHMENPAFWNKGTTTISETGELVQSSLLDDFALENISFIKIDVEGHELELVKGSLNTIVNNRPIIWLEDFTGDTKTFLETRLGYRTISFDEHSNYLLSSN